MNRRVTQYGRASGLIGMLIVLLMGAACKQKSTKAAGPTQKPPVPVTVATVTQRTIPVEVRAIGNVEAYSTITVKAKIGGQLERVYFTEGDFVKKGQVLFQIDPRPYQEQVKLAEANLAKDAANAANAEADARRYAELFKEKVVARQEAELKEATAKSLEAVLAADRAAIDNAKLNVEYCTIRSPIDGRTGNLMVKEGNLVKENDIALVTINQIHPIYVAFSVPEKEFPEINRRMAGHLPVQAFITGAEQRAVRGILTFADNSVDQATGTIRLKATFENATNGLWPGQFVNAVLTVGNQSNAVLVPSQAVQTGQNGQFVFVVKQDMKAEMRPVVMSREVGKEIAIASGVSPGETVVTDGQSRLVPGSVVQVVQTPVGGGAGL